MYFEPSILTENNNITLPFQHGGGGVEWSTVDHTFFQSNVSNSFLNFDN